MNIIIIADFLGDLSGDENNRFIYLANLLKKNGNSVELVTSDFNHGIKKKFPNKLGDINGIKLTMIPEPGYRKNICIKRFISHYIWGKRVFKYLKKNKLKPDVVYCAMPTLKAAALAGQYCNKNKIRFIIDVQDLWPEAFKMVFNFPLISSFLYFPFNHIANLSYKLADEIVAVSQTYLDRAMSCNHKAKSGYVVFLGTNLETFDDNVEKSNVIQKDKNDVWLGYCGTLGASYDLKIVFDAMRIKNIPNLKFVIMGSGPKTDEFKAYSSNLNVLFTGKLPYAEMCGILKECDIVVNPIMHNAAQSIINKHADYSAAGKPIISTQECEEYKSLIEKYNMGFNVSSDLELANALELLVNNINLRNQMGENSRKCAVDLFDREYSYEKILECIRGENGNDTN